MADDVRQPQNADAASRAAGTPETPSPAPDDTIILPASAGEPVPADATMVMPSPVPASSAPDTLDIFLGEEEETPPAPAPVTPPPIPPTAADTLVIDLDFDDTPPVPPAPRPASAPPANALVVDLDASEALPGMNSALPSGSIEVTVEDFTNETPAALPGFRAMPGAMPLPMAKKGAGAPSVVSTAANSTVLTLALAGLVGGLIGWLISEPIQATAGTGSLVGDVAIYAGLVGAAIGAALGASSGIAMGVSSKAVRGGFIGVLFGGVGGALGGALAQSVYGSIVTHYIPTFMGELLLRATGWSMMGLFFGLGQGAVVAAEKKMRNGIIGGAAGGLLGGILFKIILSAMNSSSAGVAGRCIALCLMGLAIGALIGLVEEVAKEAWLQVIAGPLTGKQLILYEERTTIGSSPKCGISLMKDPQVAPEHAAIQNEKTVFILQHMVPGGVTLVNGRPISRHLLEDGEVITIGGTQMRFHERAKTTPAKGVAGQGKGGYA